MFLRLIKKLVLKNINNKDLLTLINNDDIFLELSDDEKLKIKKIKNINFPKYELDIRTEIDKIINNIEQYDLENKII